MHTVWARRRRQRRGKDYEKSITGEKTQKKHEERIVIIWKGWLIPEFELHGSGYAISCNFSSSFHSYTSIAWSFIFFLPHFNDFFCMKGIWWIIKSKEIKEKKLKISTSAEAAVKRISSAGKIMGWKYIGCLVHFLRAVEFRFEADCVVVFPPISILRNHFLPAFVLSSVKER